jgi:ribosomal-protein-alanine N-acetyltransferase
MKKINIVSMSEKHIEEVAALEQQCFTSPWPYDEFISELENPHAVYFVAEQDHHTLGFSGLHEIIDEGYITNIAVSSQHRRQGIADLLMQAIENHAAEKHLVFITLEVRETNADAIHLYEKHGFRQVGTRRGFYTLPAEDAILMTKLI